jgi:uncharacterized protein (DUF697 family)
MGYRETIGRVMHGDYSGASEAERAAAVRDVTTVSSVAAAAVTVQPVPLLDVALLAPIHIGMVQAIGRIHGSTLDTKSAVEIIASFGASIVVRGVAFSALKLFPVFGWAAAASMAYATTYAIGEVSHCYFRSGRGMSASELRSAYRAAYEAKKAEKDATVRSDASLKERLRQLTEAFEAGLLTEEEYRKKKEDVLKEM